MPRGVSPSCLSSASRGAPPSAEFVLQSASKSLALSSLPPLDRSCLYFSPRHPLFSIVCSLFLQNTGGGVPPITTARNIQMCQCPDLPTCNVALSVVSAPGT